MEVYFVATLGITNRRLPYCDRLIMFNDHTELDFAAKESPKEPKERTDNDQEPVKRY